MTSESVTSVSESEVEHAQLQKLKLEIQNLQVQLSWRGLFAQFATAITILATSLGLLLSFQKYRTDITQDRILRERELLERLDSQYRAELTRLVQLPGEDRRSVAEAALTLKNIDSLINVKTTGDRKPIERNNVSELVVKLIGSRDYDFGKPRYVEFDAVALENWPAYSEYLVGRPTDNITILYKYFVALRALRNKEPKAVQSIVVSQNGDLVWPSPSTGFDLNIILDFRRLVEGFRRHLNLLKQSTMPQSQSDYHLETSLCWFQTATGNAQITKTVFEVDDPTFNTIWRRCFIVQ